MVRMTSASASRIVPRWRRPLGVAAVLAVSAVAPPVADAEELETTHLFGFTLGTDVNAVGEREFEIEMTGRFIKRDGTYQAISKTAGVKFIPFENFSIEPTFGVAAHRISDVTGFDDRRQFTFDTATLEMRYRLIERQHGPFGLTLGAEPHWGRVDEVSGEPVDRFGSDFALILDKELIAERLFGAINLLYGPQAVRVRSTGVWQQESEFGATAALAVQLKPGVLLGVEARHLRAYDGLGLDQFAGQAWFAGPTFYARLSEQIWIAAAWSLQLAGRSSQAGGALDLTNFERHQAKFRFGLNF
jgi:hypothetical protein